MAGSVNKVIVAFLRKVGDFSDDMACWPWLGAAKGNGYGHTTYKNKNMGAHRKSFLLFVGDIPDGYDVCHKCDNRWCVNPYHLFLGTRAENMADAVAKKRTAGGIRKHLNQSQVQEIQRMLNTGISQAEVARVMDVNRETISKINSGESYVGQC